MIDVPNRSRIGEYQFAEGAVTVVLASGGYPGEYRKGFSITGLERIDGAQPSDLKVQWALQKIRVKVFQSGTGLSAGQLVTDGGRVLAVTAMADDLQKAVDTAYQAADMIQFEGKHYRRDVAHRALKNSSAELSKVCPAKRRTRVCETISEKKL